MLVTGQRFFVFYLLDSYERENLLQGFLRGHYWSLNITFFFSCYWLFVIFYSLPVIKIVLTDLKRADTPARIRILKMTFTGGFITWTLNLIMLQESNSIYISTFTKETFLNNIFLCPHFFEKKGKKKKQESFLVRRRAY